MYMYVLMGDRHTLHQQGVTQVIEMKFHINKRLHLKILINN